MPLSIEELQQAMAEHQYIADRALATTVYLAQALQKPIFLEGEAGVGKTEVAKVLAKVFDTNVIRLQCYEGIDANHALYEWNYAKQIMRIRLEEKGDKPKEHLEKSIYSEEYLIKRSLLEAITSDSLRPPVLLIDEIDRSDEEFEAFLLEVLSDFQVTIPEIGTIVAKKPPFVVLTSNRTREIHDALKRRCLYLWIAYPTFEREYEIVTTRIPLINERLAAQVCRFMQAVRLMDFFKRPGVAETLDWARALLALSVDELDKETVTATLGCLFKYREDMQKMMAELDAILARVCVPSL
ncbi:MAG: MoxR family ATPase [Chloroflexi bacterium]|nr:MoxR family ATPase [Chloroflexota bacterium]